MAELQWLDDESVLRDSLIAELESNVRALCAQVCALDCGCALLRLLGANANMLSMLDDIAYHLNESSADVESGLRRLTELGLVRQVDLAGITFYGITVDPKRRQHARELCVWLDRWHARMGRIERLLGGPFDKKRETYLED